MSDRHATSPTQQRLVALLVTTVAATMTLIAFMIAKAACCDARQVTVICTAAFVSGLALGGAANR